MACFHLSRRKVTDNVNNRQLLVEAILDEDRLLRRKLVEIPNILREVRGPCGTLTFKETLGHIAFWDNFTVDYFTNRLDQTSLNPKPLVNFEEESCQALEVASGFPFGEVLIRYLEATGALTLFLGQHWFELSAREKHDFWVPLKHRRLHRISLFQTLEDHQVVPEMAAEA